ncbi:unnamed protein product [Meloidogyne enterolobii]|uniref:Uncharacterized protein n=1 Tax=Meloidogyne enterolobii TaxID=390850 RepID=A0ACB0ZZL1_MELEN
MAVLFKILAQGGNKFVNLTFTYLHTNLYKWSIKHLETSNDITKTVKKIKFEKMFGPRILSEEEENINVIYYKEEHFQLVNKHNPKIKFSVYIEEDVETAREIIYAEIKRI